MSNDALIILAIVSTMIWITVSKEATKPTKEVNKRKMITLLSAGTLSAILLTVSLFQHLLFSFYLT
ncbi:hypothetical protein B857_02636 [Solibacillus isronensis B3W22]|uniref:Uncharacterized protein n=2 Tax=Solibacillus TaxID=648800 RepID=F2F9C8_SOLSS|nr:hypothetical protein [Solibacillus silvestris]AMO85431.1 hypothetical protein SOLI23_07510 [Solibacillus silvestris]EKB44534.1 hypothetical protein B857_02636 [Solibacillus isronensis B3W22]BAK16655.1 hypothetical protein SSIL_2232 [Solibacillus silvestris StLB046]